MKSKVYPLKGQNVRLREITLEDAPDVVRWRNDPDIGTYLGNTVLSLTDQQTFMSNYLSRDNDYYFIVELLSSGTPVGTIALYAIDPLASTAEYGRILILPAYRLFSLESVCLCLEFGFKNLNLNKIYCTVQAQNLRSVAFNLKLGFKREGLLRQHYWNGETVDDIHQMAMFNQDFAALDARYKTTLKGHPI